MSTAPLVIVNVSSDSHAVKAQVAIAGQLVAMRWTALNRGLCEHSRPRLRLAAALVAHCANSPTRGGKTHLLYADAAPIVQTLERRRRPASAPDKWCAALLCGVGVDD